MPNIADLLRAFVVGGAQFGQNQRATQERKRTQGIEDQENERARTAALLQQQVLQGQLGAQQRAAAAPQAPTRGTPEYLEMLRGEREATSPAGPQAPVRGTPEYEDMLGREGEIAARFRPPPAPNAQGPARGSPEYLQMLEDEAKARAQAGGTNSEQARMARSLAPLMDDAYTRIQSMDTPDLRQKIASKGFAGFGNYFNTPEGRQFRQASLQFLSMALSITSGKTVSEQEVERTNAWLVPAAGDDPGTTDIKINAMKRLAAAAHSLGGSTPSPGAKPSGLHQSPELDALPDDPDEAARLYPGRATGPGPRR